MSAALVPPRTRKPRGRDQSRPARILVAFLVFWGPMAIAIMGGLVSATVLILCFVPALHAAWSRTAPRALARQALGNRLLEGAGAD